MIEKLNMSKVKMILLIAIGIILFQSCNSPDSREIKFNSEIQDVADIYKKQLEPEIFRISPGWFKLDQVTTHKVIVTIYNSNKIPKEFDEKKRLAFKIASDVYPHIINKNDYSKVEIVFQNQSGEVVKTGSKSNFPFSYEEIEQYIENTKK